MLRERPDIQTPPGKWGEHQEPPHPNPPKEGSPLPSWSTWGEVRGVWEAGGPVPPPRLPRGPQPQTIGALEGSDCGATARPQHEAPEPPRSRLRRLSLLT